MLKKASNQLDSLTTAAEGNQNSILTTSGNSTSQPGADSDLEEGEIVIKQVHCLTSDSDDSSSGEVTKKTQHQKAPVESKLQSKKRKSSSSDDSEDGIEESSRERYLESRTNSHNGKKFQPYINRKAKPKNNAISIPLENVNRKRGQVDKAIPQESFNIHVQQSLQPPLYNLPPRQIPLPVHMQENFAGINPPSYNHNNTQFQSAPQQHFPHHPQNNFSEFPSYQHRPPSYQPINHQQDLPPFSRPNFNPQQDPSLGFQNNFNPPDQRFQQQQQQRPFHLNEFQPQYQPPLQNQHPQGHPMPYQNLTPPNYQQRNLPSNFPPIRNPLMFEGPPPPHSQPVNINPQNILYPPTVQEPIYNPPPQHQNFSNNHNPLHPGNQFQQLGNIPPPNYFHSNNPHQNINPPGGFGNNNGYNQPPNNEPPSNLRHQQNNFNKMMPTYQMQPPFEGNEPQVRPFINQVQPGSELVDQRMRPPPPEFQLHNSNPCPPEQNFRPEAPSKIVPEDLSHVNQNHKRPPPPGQPSSTETVFRSDFIMEELSPVEADPLISNTIQNNLRTDLNTDMEGDTVIDFDLLDSVMNNDNSKQFDDSKVTNEPEVNNSSTDAFFDENIFLNNFTSSHLTNASLPSVTAAVEPSHKRKELDNTILIKDDDPQIISMNILEHENFKTKPSKTNPEELLEVDSPLLEKPQEIPMPPPEQPKKKGLSFTIDTTPIARIQNDADKDNEGKVEASKELENKERHYRILGYDRSFRTHEKNLFEKLEKMLVHTEPKKEVLINKEESSKDGNEKDQLVEEEAKKEFNYESRYFIYNPTMVCNRCRKPGHFEKWCSEEVVLKCLFCLEAHRLEDCNQIVCFRCFGLGHRNKDCRVRDVITCYRCGKRGHPNTRCGGLFPKDREQIRREKKDYARNTKCLYCGCYGHALCVVNTSDNLRFGHLDNMYVEEDDDHVEENSVSKESPEPIKIQNKRPFVELEQRENGKLDRIKKEEREPESDDSDIFEKNPEKKIKI